MRLPFEVSIWHGWIMVHLVAVLFQTVWGWSWLLPPTWFGTKVSVSLENESTIGCSLYVGHLSLGLPDIIKRVDSEIWPTKNYRNCAHWFMYLYRYTGVCVNTSSYEQHLRYIYIWRNRYTNDTCVKRLVWASTPLWYAPLPRVLAQGRLWQRSWQNTCSGLRKELHQTREQIQFTW